MSQKIGVISMTGIKFKHILIFAIGLAFVVFKTNEVYAQEKNDSLFFSQIDTSFCKYLTASDRSQWEISTEDSIRSYKEMFLPGYQIFIKYRDLQDNIKKGTYSVEEKLTTIIDLLEQIREKFEEALKLNPFGTNYRIAMQRIYNDLEDAYRNAKDERKQFTILNRKICYEDNRVSKMTLHYRLGRIYSNHNLWAKAEENFQLACNLIFDTDDGKIDSTSLFYFLYSRAESQMKQYKADHALVSYEYALKIAPDKHWKQQIAGWIIYITWDDRNLKSAELRQKAISLINEKNYDEAETTYKDVIEIIKTKKALHDVQLRLAMIQFYNLNKEEEGINRLWNVVKGFSLDPLTKAPIDSSEIIFWNSYTQMCFRLANENLTTEKKKSFTYFYKISNIEGPLRGKAYLSLANLSGANNDICLEYCNKAYEYFYQFNDSEKKLLFELLYTTYLKNGNYAQALEWFKKYKEI